MSWIGETLRAHPEVALFATLAFGHAFAPLRIGSVKLNPIIGVLVVGLLIGQVGIVVPSSLQWAFFSLRAPMRCPTRSQAARSPRARSVVRAAARVRRAPAAERRDRDG